MDSISKQHCRVQWKLDLADTDLAENLDLKDTLQKIWATIFDFQYISPLKIAENLVLADKSSVTDFSAKSSFHCISFCNEFVNRFKWILLSLEFLNY